jgi:amino acid transporter
VGSIFDMAIYPTLFVSYLSRFFPQATAGWRGILIGAGLIAVAALWNMRGAAFVGGSSVGLGVLLLSPFAVLAVVALFHRAPAAHPIPLRNVDFLAGILVAMWNFMGWDNLSTIANDVDRPQRTYPAAMAAAVLLVALSAILPIAAVATTGIDANSWSTGGWADLAKMILPNAQGAVLAVCITLAGVVAAFGTQNALTMTLARLPVVLAQDGFLPRIFEKRLAGSKAPWVSIVICSVVWGLGLGLSFVKLIILDVLLTGLSILLEFASLVALRIREPGLKRPYKIPGGVPATVMLAAPPAALLGLTIMRNKIEPVGPINALELGGILIGLGGALYWAQRLAAARARGRT